MKFIDLAIGDIFEYRDNNADRKVAVKISDRSAWLFQDNVKAHMAHNRSVWIPDTTGRLMRDKQGRLCVMGGLDNSGNMAGFVVVPVAFTIGRRQEYTLIKGKVKQEIKEVDIILSRISQSMQNTEKLLDALEVLLLNM